MKRRTVAISSLVVGFAAVVSCAAPSAPPPASPSAPAAITEAPPPAAEAAWRPTKKTRKYATRPVPPRITTPMKGEPAPAVTAKETRLQATTCDEIGKEEIEARIKAMRATVDRSFKDWHDGQPECWRQDREEYFARKEAARLMEAGGLGLSGVGYGGGGVGQGIGLGSIGTIGHGAGSGVGYGSGRGAAGAASHSAGPAKATSASGTNNQIASVDEADIVKTDGRYVYLAANGALRIVEAMNPRVLSVTKVAGTARELFVEGDKVVLYASGGRTPHRCTYGYDCTFGGDGTTTKITVFDVSDRNAPKVMREVDATGSLIAARRIGNTVHTVVADGDMPGPAFASWPPDLQMCGTEESKVRARFAKLKVENEEKIRKNPQKVPTLKENGGEQKMCGQLMRTAIRDGQAYTSVVSFDLTDDKTPPTTATVQSRPGAVFASDTGLYLSVVHRKPQSNGRWYSFHPSVDEVSEIHKFTIGASPKATKYVGSGTVPGHVLNQFSMDEWNGYLRIATTRGKVPDPKVSSAVSILAESEGNLVRVGAIENIAPGEDIRAVRFDDDRGYVVTFKKTDPLFVMDLYEVQKPRILGELKIPGFSTYIHRIDPEHLLSIGFDADDKGSFAYFDGIILQLFDVKNPTDPRLVHKEKIGTRGSSSEAATNHLAFNYFAQEGLLAIPMTLCEGGGDGRNGNLAFSGLLVYEVDEEKGFTRVGGVDHGTKGVSCNTWWSNANSAVKRSVFLDDLVYSIAGDRVKVARMPKMADIADLPLLDSAK